MLIPFMWGFWKLPESLLSFQLHVYVVGTCSGCEQWLLCWKSEFMQTASIRNLTGYHDGAHNQGLVLIMWYRWHESQAGGVWLVWLKRDQQLNCIMKKDDCLICEILVFVMLCWISVKKIGSCDIWKIAGTSFSLTFFWGQMIKATLSLLKCK